MQTHGTMTLRVKHLKRLSSLATLQREDGWNRGSTNFFSSLPRLEQTANRSHASPTKEWDTQFREEWTRLRTVVYDLFQSKSDPHQPSFQPGQLASLHEDIHLLLLSKAGAFIFEFYQNNLLPAAADLLLTAVREGLSDLVSNLTAAWQHFYTHILPALQAIFLHVKNPRLSIRQATLLAFRDHIVLKLENELSPILSEMFSEGSVSPALRQMFLVLQNVADCYPPSAQRLQFETMTSQVVSPYLGFKGLYTDGQTKPVIKSKELEVAHLRRISVVDPRRLTRPLSVNSSLQVVTLTDLFTLSLDRQFKRSASRDTFV